MWYVGGDAHKIKLLQQKLYSLGIFNDKLKEDGVYGKKTAMRVFEFVNIFTIGSVPTLGWMYCKLKKQELSYLRQKRVVN